MKKKLDLNGLLSKYEGFANTHTGSYYSPTKGYDYEDFPNKNRTVNQDFYQSRQFSAGEEGRYIQPVTSKF